jgi:hypothetical protein
MFLALLLVFFVSYVIADVVQDPVPVETVEKADANHGSILVFWKNVSGVDFRFTMIAVALILFAATFTTIYMHMEEKEHD